MLHATPPRLFANILQVAPKIFVGFFCVFDKRQRARVIRSEKNSVKHQQFKDLVICFSVNFWWTCWLDFCHNYFCHKLYDFFDGGVGGVNFFFLLHNDYLKPVFFYLAQRGERRFVVDIGSLSSSPTAWLKNKMKYFNKYSLD